jgi:hypothetical protein
MSARGKLSQSEIETYQRDGLVAPAARLSDALLARMHASLDALLTGRADIAPESLVCPHLAGANHTTEAAAQWFDYAREPVILDRVEQLIGPDIILWGSQVFCKPARNGRAVPWHQDGRYWPIRPLATCSAWIALDAATPENGCVRFVPGSHRSRTVLQHRPHGRPDDVLDQELEADACREDQARNDELEAGQFSLHDVFLVHGSAANRSQWRRAAFVIRYMPASSLFDRSLQMDGRQAGVAFNLSQRPIFLLRGRDRAGNDFALGQGEGFRLEARVSDEA